MTLKDYGRGSKEEYAYDVYALHRSEKKVDKETNRDTVVEKS
jgi:hypothetical protein